MALAINLQIQISITFKKSKLHAGFVITILRYPEFGITEYEFGLKSIFIAKLFVNENF